VGTHPGVVNSAKDHAADLIIGAFFFAMRACEYVRTRVEGKTRLTTLGCVKFFTKSRVEISHSDTNLIPKAKYVQIVFVGQKNGVRFEKRTQSRTKDPKLCPVLRFGRAVQRVLQFVPGANSGTPLCSTSALPSPRFKFITSGATFDLVRETCRAHGGKDKFRFNPKDVGNKSLRSGAAMALFLQDHSTDKIMILGRWKSKAFLDYICPQVIAWTGCFSEDMIGFDNFFELFSKQVKDPKGTEVHGNRSLIPELSLKF
jgi:hypothetical protein